MKDYIVGRNPVFETMPYDRIQKIFLQKGNLKGAIEKIIRQAKEKQIPIEYVNKGFLDDLANGNAHQGVAALVASFSYANVDEILSFAAKKREDPFLILLDGITDPHNLGSIIRTAEVAGAHGVIFPKNRSCEVNTTVMKSSAGACNHIKIAKVTNLNQTIQRLKKENIFVYAACGEAAEDYTKTNLTGKIALVIGNEGKGVSPLVQKNADARIKIPMYGKMESLNASVAAAILIYEVVRQNAR